MSLLNSIGELFSSLFKASPEAQELKVRIKEQKRRDNIYWNNRLKQILAECDVSELKLMQELVDSDNKPVKTKIIPKVDSSRRVKIKGIEENLYQILEEYTSNRYGYNSVHSVMVRISVPVFSVFKTEFNKYGRCRLPESQQGVKVKK